MSVCKWSYYVWACEVESQPDIEWADSELKCGYCRTAIERHGVLDCRDCTLRAGRFCGVGDSDAYHITVNRKLDWTKRRRAARKMFREILSDMPREFKR